MKSVYASDTVKLLHAFALATCIGMPLLLSGCTARSIPLAGAPTGSLWKDTPVVPRSATLTNSPYPEPTENPESQLTLAEAIRLSLLNSPELGAYGLEIRAREARLLQAGRPPNPQMGVVVEDLGPAALGQPSEIQSQTTIELSQLVELGGKRAARMQLAAITRDLASWDFEAARINLLTRVTHSYISVLAAQESLGLATQAQALAEQVRETVGARVTAGVVSGIEETKASIAVASARMEVEQARRTLSTARTRLVANWGATEAKFSGAIGNLQSPREVPSFDELRKLLAANPEVARWAVEISQRQAAVALEQTKRTPDVNISGGYRRFHGTNNDALVIGATIPLPIFDRNEDGITEAQQHAAKAEEDRRSAEARVFAALTEAYQMWSTAQAEVAAIELELLPGAQETFDAINEGYRAGKFGYLDVLDAQRTLNGVRSQQLKAFTVYQQAATDIERLIGAPLNNNLMTPAPSDGK